MTPVRRPLRIPVQIVLLATAATFAGPPAIAKVAVDPLPSWLDGATQRRLVSFVNDVTRPGSPSFVPPDERIAVFDDDGTLWSEKPVGAELAFAIDRVKALAADHPEWSTRQPFKAALEDDLATLHEGGPEALLELSAATHAGLTTERFAELVREWLGTARHPRFERPYTELVYAPMLELMHYLRANGFKTYIVTGGSTDFVREFAQEVYGVPPEQVIGSEAELRLEVEDGRPVLVRGAQVDFVDDGPQKPVAIHRRVGRRPMAAFGNSDGDLEMLAWTTAAPGPRLGLLVRHTDRTREYGYDRTSPVGRLDLALDAAKARGWAVVDMKSEWSSVHPVTVQIDAPLKKH